jgi:hypothetical protein
MIRGSRSNLWPDPDDFRLSRLFAIYGPVRGRALHHIRVLGYDLKQGAWPFGIIESIWGLVAIHRWRTRDLGRCA